MSLKTKTIITDKMKYPLTANKIYIETSLGHQTENVKRCPSPKTSRHLNLVTVEAKRKISQLFSLGKTKTALKSYCNWLCLESGVHLVFLFSHVTTIGEIYMKSN